MTHVASSEHGIHPGSSFVSDLSGPSNQGHAPDPWSGQATALIPADALVSVEQELLLLSEQMTRTFEELSLIHELAGSERVMEDRSSHCKAAIERLLICLPVQTLVLRLEHDTSEDATQSSTSEFLMAGTEVDRDLLQRIEDELEAAGQPVLNHPLRCAPQIDRVAGVVVNTPQGVLGKLMALGRSPASELGTVEIQLMQSVARILSTQLEIHQQFEAMRRMFQGIVEALVSAIDAKDQYTCGHSSRVSAMAEALAADYGLSSSEVDTVRMSGLLHDVGKIGVSDAVLCKPGRLTDEEFTEIKKHPELGYNILKGVPQFSDILPGVRYHHEAFDGTGYPEGLKGKGIPLIARILAVADAFDAMTSTRTYRAGMPLEKVIEIFIEGCGTQWDPDVVSILLEDEERLQRFIETGRP